MNEKTKTPPSINFKTKDGQPFDVPAEGSLGLLALGYVGLMAWREKRREVSEQNKSGDKA